jgi:transcriptional regulator with PAS, ATPase and Fis domain
MAESELFGYEKGAFTGALKEGKSGLFADANGGILFLDEIHNLSKSVQAKLMTAIQTDRENNMHIRKFGSNKTTPL